MQDLAAQSDRLIATSEIIWKDSVSVSLGVFLSPARPEKTLTWMVPRRSRSLRLCFALQCSLAKHSILEYSVCRKYVANMLIGLDCYIIHFIMHFSTYAHF